MSHTHTLQMVDTYSQTFVPLFPLIFFPSSKLLSVPPITFIPSVTLFFISPSIPPFPSTNISRYLNSSTSSNFSPPTSTPSHSSPLAASSLPPILITLLFVEFTLSPFDAHSLTNSFTNILSFFPDSATNTASSTNNKTLTSHSPSPLLNLIPFPSLSIPLTTPSINTLNNHGDITHPCLSPTPILNHSVSSLFTLTLALQFS